MRYQEAEEVQGVGKHASYKEEYGMKKKVLIMGAAGRDFHNFKRLFRKIQILKVVCFTATQIPNIENRIYPPELSGPLYQMAFP